MSTLLDTPPNATHVESLTGWTPWEVCLRLADHKHLLFLDSAQASARGPYAFVSAEPASFLTSTRGVIRENGQRLGAADPLTVLAARVAEFPLAPLPGLPPFQGGAAGLFSYDLCHHFERLPRPAHDDFAVPDLAVGMYDWVIAFDLPAGKAWLISTGYPETEPGRRRQRALQRAEQVKRLLDRLPVPATARMPGRAALRTPQFPVPDRPGLTSDFDHAGYERAVARAIEYIHAGDCFQVNLAQRLLMPAAGRPLELYQRLRHCNPAPFAGYFDLGAQVLLSASPERFLRVHAREVETRPIKGTRPRSHQPGEDERLAQELRDSAKDRAENVMIVDLLRNDLGRVCAYGTVRVESLCRLESHPFVHHLVSEVRGRLRPGMDATDLLRAAFPGGSVTGAPKIRAMEIIAELEPTARGPYCGCLGYLGFDGSMDTNLLIRTLVHGQGWLHFSVGGGIVADSLPAREYAETWHKAAGILQALQDF